MDPEVKKEIVASVIPAVGVPLVRAAVNHRYTMKQMERREEIELEKAERQAESVQAMARVKGGGGAGAAVGRTDPVTLDSPGDVYDELESIKRETNCSFCHQAVDSLMDAPPEEARKGYDELRAYLREVERVEKRNVSEGEAEQIVDDLVSRWDVVPRHVSGMA